MQNIGPLLEVTVHIIHLCPLHMRSPSLGKRYQLVEFVKFLKRNPRAFEWPGADLSQSDGGVLWVVEARLWACPWTSVTKPSYLLGLLVVRCWRELTPHSCLVWGWPSECTSFLVRMLPSFSTGDHLSLGRGRRIPISPIFICFSSELVGIYWLDHICT